MRPFGSVERSGLPLRRSVTRGKNVKKYAGMVRMAHVESTNPVAAMISVAKVKANKDTNHQKRSPRKAALIP